MEPMSKSKTFEINWFAASGSALGAVSSAVVLSSLGAAGTLIGAALGSLVITVGGSIYTQSLQKTKAHVDTRLGTRRSTRVNSADVEEGRGSSSVATAVLTPEPPRKTLAETLRALPWRHITLLALGLFVATMVVILAFELSTGRPVSSFTGGTSETRTGTTFSGFRSSSDNPPDTQDALQTESPTPVPSAEATPTPTPEQSPSDQPTAVPSSNDQPTAVPSASDQPTQVQPTQEQPTGEPTPAVNPPEPPAPVPPPADQQQGTGG